MENQYDFLDPSEKHTLSSAECELVTFFRFFNEDQRKLLFKLAWTMALNDKRVGQSSENI